VHDGAREGLATPGVFPSSFALDNRRSPVHLGELYLTRRFSLCGQELFANL